MFFSSLTQIYVLSVFLYIGIICGMLYNVFALLHKQKTLITVLDICFCLMCILFFLVCALITNFGQIRLFMILGFLIGLYVGSCTLGKTVANFTIVIYNKIKGMLKFLKHKYFNKETKTSDRK